MSLISIARLSPVINAATKAEGDTASAKSLRQGLTPSLSRVPFQFLFYQVNLNECFIMYRSCSIVHVFFYLKYMYIYVCRVKNCKKNCVETINRSFRVKKIMIEELYSTICDNIFRTVFSEGLIVGKSFLD